ncbi:hypothetical protein SAMN03159363_2173 [Variovorax sp. EL159]|nr:hypothetical protein SAMN03159363_2173 [Variovorax sp. EL159]
MVEQGHFGALCCWCINVTTSPCSLVAQDAPEFPHSHQNRSRESYLSTTFEVYPQSRGVPSFNELIELATIRLSEQLRRRGINAEPKLQALVLRASSNEKVAIALDGPMTWEEDKYAWLCVSGVPGGTDVTYQPVREIDRRNWRHIFKSNTLAKAEESRIESCLDVGYFCTFRRSAGQPAIINFAYGIIAASLAELTDGIIYSDDSAWDDERFPAAAAGFYEWFFDPESTSDNNRANWARTCLAMIANDPGLQEASAPPPARQI